MLARSVICVVFTMLAFCSYANRLSANGESLYGVHWWDWDNGSQIGPGPNGGWSTETVLTHSAPWWAASYFQPLYQGIHSNNGASIITRVDYNWGETVPSPSNPDRANWTNDVVNVVNTLGSHSNVWIIGNEPNIIGEGNGWLDNKITPSGYAEIYTSVRAAIKAIRPNDEVLLAPPSPGGIIPGVRWKSGNDWLAETITAVDALPGGTIDGFALHAYGSPFLSGQPLVDAFRNDYESQLAVLDGLGYQDAPVYITEWARSTNTAGNLAANEAITADFIRGALADVHQWNITPGNHNIVSLSWFVGNADYGGWSEYSLEHWQQMGNPPGHPDDLLTALQESSSYPAGLKGTRPLPMGPEVGDFNEDGRTDGIDFLILQRGFGLGVPALPSQGDTNDDGVVDSADLQTWELNYGQVGQQSTSTQFVPEPSSVALQLLAASLILGSRRISGGKTSADFD